MFLTELSPQQRVDKGVIKIMSQDRYKALAGILMIGDRKVMADIPGWPAWAPTQTAMTNGRDEWYSEGFITELSDKQLRGLLLHEAGHKMYRHLTTWKHLYEIDAECANRAADNVLNLRIKEDNERDGFAELPPNPCCEDRFIGMNTQQIFNILYEEKKSGGGGGGGGGTGIDGERDRRAAEGCDGDMLDVHDWDGAQSLTDEEKHQLEKDIDEAVRQGALAAGKTGSGGNRDIDALLEPQVDWRQVLRDFVTEVCDGNDYSTWRMPSKRYLAGGLYMPRGISETVDEICVEIDMSYSTIRQVPTFLTEFVAICKQVKPKKVRILWWDTTVAREETFEQGNFDAIEKKVHPSGGGGTTVQCVPDYCNKFGIKPQAHIVLTDGYLGGNWGKGWNAPVLWAICDNKSARPDSGKYVHIET